MKVTDVTRSSATLKWSAPSSDGGAPLEGYVIEKRTSTSHRWTRVNRKPIRETEFAYTDLPEGEEYQFRVMAVNEAGIGKPSENTETIKIKAPYG